MYSVSGNTITLTRGDTFKATISLTNGTEPYEPAEGDVIRFAMKESYDAAQVSVEKTIPNNTLRLQLDPADTKTLAFGTYVYDIQLTYANGDVDTFIKGKLKLTEEVK